VRLGDGRLRSGWYGLAAVQGGTGDLAVPDQEADPGTAVGNQAVQRHGARAQRRRPGKHLLLEGPLVVVQPHRRESDRPGHRLRKAAARMQAPPGIGYRRLSIIRIIYTA
jgi:hypothetical protein